MLDRLQVRGGGIRRGRERVAPGQLYGGVRFSLAVHDNQGPAQRREPDGVTREAPARMLSWVRTFSAAGSATRCSAAGDEATVPRRPPVKRISVQSRALPRQAGVEQSRRGGGGAIRTHGT